MSCLRQDILCDLWLNFQTKISDLRILVGDEMPKLRPYCFGRSCLSVEMLQWFVVCAYFFSDSNFLDVMDRSHRRLK